MMTKADTKERATIYLSPKISNLLKKAAKEEGRSFTKQVERILKEWLIQNGYLKEKA